MAGFFDPFFVVVAIIVAALSAIDWLLGRVGRERMKKRVKAFWRTLQHSNLDDLTISALNPVRRLLNKIYGTRVGWRLITAAFISNWLLVEVLAIAILGEPIISLIARREDEVSLLPESLLITVAAIGWIPYRWLIVAFNSDVKPGNALTAWAKNTAILIAKFAGFSVFYILVFEAVFLVLSHAVTDAFAQIDISDIGSNPDAWVDLIFKIVLIFWLIGSVVLFPILAAILLFIFLVLLKVLRPWIQPATALVLDRLCESEKGVLTQLALGLGFVVKLTQEILKHTGSLG